MFTVENLEIGGKSLRVFDFDGLTGVLIKDLGDYLGIKAQSVCYHVDRHNLPLTKLSKDQIWALRDAKEVSYHVYRASLLPMKSVARVIKSTQTQEARDLSDSNSI